MNALATALTPVSFIKRHLGLYLIDRKLRYGEIKGSILNYITIPMIVIFSFVVVIVGSSIETLQAFFETNVALNGLIIGTGIFTLTNVFISNLVIYRTSRFLRCMQELQSKPDVTREDVHNLKKMLEKDGASVNSKQMMQAIERIGEIGHPNFSEADARHIKTVLGRRIVLRRSNIGFYGGLLVMLGLLGTFLGLLNTIDAVGEAMAGMANMGGGEGGEVGTDEMSSFIGSLAGPLQGMGLAFSSSLFGLSGSLLVGFFNHLCSGAQNRFVEDASRWLDERILEFDPKTMLEGKGQGADASEDSLRSWLSSFAYLSIKTNRKLGRLVYSFSKAAQVSVKVLERLDLITAQQKANNEEIGKVHTGLDGMREQQRETGEKLTTSLDHIHGATQNASKQLEAVQQASQTMTTSLDHIHGAAQTTNTQLQAMQQTGQAITTSLSNLQEAARTTNTHLETVQTAGQTLRTSMDAIQGTINITNNHLETAEETRLHLKQKIEELTHQFQTGMSENRTHHEEMNGQALASLSAIQDGMREGLNKLSAQLETTGENEASMAGALQQSVNTVREMQAQTQNLHALVQQAVTAIPELGAKIEIMAGRLQGISDTLTQNLSALVRTAEKEDASLPQMISHLQEASTSLQQLNKVQDGILLTIEKFRSQAEAAAANQNQTDITNKLNALVSEIKKVSSGSSNGRRGFFSGRRESKQQMDDNG